LINFLSQIINYLNLDIYYLSSHHSLFVMFKFKNKLIIINSNN